MNQTEFRKEFVELVSWKWKLFRSTLRWNIPVGAVLVDTRVVNALMDNYTTKKGNRCQTNVGNLKRSTSWKIKKPCLLKQMANNGRNVILSTVIVDFGCFRVEIKWNRIFSGKDFRKFRTTFSVFPKSAVENSVFSKILVFH